MAKGLWNRINAGKAQDADDQIAKRSHNARSISGSDPGTVLFKSDITDIVKPVFDPPVVAVQGKKPSRAGLSGMEAREAESDFLGVFVLFQITGLASYDKGLLDAGEISVAVKLSAGPDLAGFYAAVCLIDTLVLRGENRSDRGLRYRPVRWADCL